MMNLSAKLFSLQMKERRLILYLWRLEAEDINVRFVGNSIFWGNWIIGHQQ